MTLNSTLLQNSISSSNMMSTSVNSTTSLSDIQSSRYTTGHLGNASSGTRHSPLTSDMPGPSGIGPVQHAPLVRLFELGNVYKDAHSLSLAIHLQSLKKESDWDRSDDKESTSSDYRHSHEMVSWKPFFYLCRNKFTPRASRFFRFSVSPFFSGEIEK